MLNFFPTIYEGELLYSVISRYKRTAGIINKRALMEDLYGQVVSLNNLHFPVHIDDLIDNLLCLYKITSDKLIKENTLYRPFTAFLNEDKAQRIMEIMKNGKSSNPYANIGLVGSKIKMNNNLLYCSHCVKEDIAKYGEAYWRVLHQIPGIFYCDKHYMPLLKSDIYVNRSRVEHICADAIDYKNNRLVVEDNIMNINLRYIENMKYLLNNDIKRREKRFLLGIYIDKLRERGFTSKNGSINIKDFETSFKIFYGEHYLTLMQSNIELDKENNWLKLFIRDSNKEKHMLRHLLVINFLGMEVKDFFEINSVVGKKEYIYVPNPRLDKYEQREKWIKLLKENKGLSRSEYKKIGKGLYTWLYRNDNEWFNKVTPKKLNNNKYLNIQ